MEDFWSPLQHIIKDVCLTFDKTWQVRKRVIDTYFLVIFIFKIVISKNQQGYKSLLNEMWEKEELTRYQTEPIAASSLCEARSKLPEEIFTKLNSYILNYYDTLNSAKTNWCGHRIFACDGSKIHIPYKLRDPKYKTSNNNQYYPQGLMSIIYNLGTGLVHNSLFTSTKSERHCLIKQLESLSENDVVVLDRGYFCYLLLYMFKEKNINLVCRLQSGSMNKEIANFWNSNLNDIIIEYYPSNAVKSEIKKQGFILNYKPIQLRLIKYKIKDETYVCATSLIGKQYKLDEFAKIYHGRWGIEELYKISKNLINVDDFHGKSERAIKQEIYAHVLLINIGRIFELEANQKVPPEKKTSKNRDAKDLNQNLNNNYWQEIFCGIEKIKINFKNCLLVISRFLDCLMMSSEDKIKKMLANILKSISRVRQKIRVGRHYPRISRKPHNKWNRRGAHAAKL